MFGKPLNPQAPHTQTSLTDGGASFHVGNPREGGVLSLVIQVPEGLGLGSTLKGLKEIWALKRCNGVRYATFVVTWVTLRTSFSLSFHDKLTVRSRSVQLFVEAELAKGMRQTRDTLANLGLLDEAKRVRACIRCRVLPAHRRVD